MSRDTDPDKLEEAAGTIRGAMADRHDPVTYAWFSVSRLLEEIAKEVRAGRAPGEHVETAAMDIARHVTDHGPLIPPGGVGG